MHDSLPLFSAAEVAAVARARAVVSRRHPDTSRDAAKKANENGAYSQRVARCIEELDKAGAAGLTDDELERLTGWSHQSASAAMSFLRRKTTLVLTPGLKRPTRSGCMARVNVLARHHQGAPRE